MLEDYVKIYEDGTVMAYTDRNSDGEYELSIFDKKGNIVSVDAPRPSSPELKKMLENELKK